jgi:hypothetical protein
MMRSRRMSRRENLKGRDFFGEIGEDGMIKLNWICLSVIGCVYVGVTVVIGCVYVGVTVVITATLRLGL